MSSVPPLVQNQIKIGDMKWRWWRATPAPSPHGQKNAKNAMEIHLKNAHRTSAQAIRRLVSGINRVAVARTGVHDNVGIIFFVGGPCEDSEENIIVSSKRHRLFLCLCTPATNAEFVLPRRGSALLRQMMSSFCREEEEDP